jgi:tripartite-type tricarboxylate transporter receptor subunit TctC
MRCNGAALIEEKYIMQDKWKRLRYALIAPAVMACSTATVAQDKVAGYPVRPIRIIIAVAPGAGADMVARLTGRVISERLGQNVVVDSRPGAGGVIASGVAAKADPDGYTLFQNGFGLLMQGATKRVDFDVLKTFEPIVRTTSQPYILMASTNVSAKTFKELLAESQAKPLTYAGSSGIGSAVHLGIERLARLSGLKVKHVAYKGSAPAILAVMGGEIHMAAGSAMSAVGAVKTGKVRALANLGLDRIPALPDLPTLAEQGYPGFTVDNAYNLWVRAGTPRPIIELLNRVVSEGMNTPEVAKVLMASGSAPGKPLPPQTLKAELTQEYGEIVDAVNKLGLKF